MAVRSNVKRKSSSVEKKTAGKKKPRGKVAGIAGAYTFEQIAYLLWMAYGQGAQGCSIHPEVAEQGSARYAANVRTRVDDRDFENEALRNAALRCSVCAGEISSALARARGRVEIRPTDFAQACQFLEQVLAGGAQGIVCS